MTHDDQSATPDAPQASTYLPTPNPYKEQLQALRDAGGWISVDASEIQKLMQRVIDAGDVFTNAEALIDLTYWMDKRTLKPQSYYAKRWKWHRMKVLRFFKTLNLGCDKSVQPCDRSVPKHSDSDSENGAFVTEVCNDVTEVYTYIQTIPDHTQTVPEKELLPSGGSALNAKPKTTTDHIAAIYAAYPRKVARSKALKAIKKALLSVPYETLLASVHQFAASVAGKDPQFTPYPASWFNAERWLDDPIPQTSDTPTNKAATPTIDTRPRIDGILVGEGHTSLSQHSLDSLYRSKQRRLADEASYRNRGIAATVDMLAAPVPEPGVLVVEHPNTDRRFHDDTHRMAS